MLLRVAVRSAFLAGSMAPLLAIAACGTGTVAEGPRAVDLAVIRRDLTQKAPRATSMIPHEFIAVSMGTGSNNDELASSKALTFALLLLPWDSPDPEMRFEPGGMTHDTLKSHILRKGLATLIHAENVERIDLRSVDGDAAFGTLAFRVPGLMSGHVHFRASKVETTSWRFDEFVLWGSKQRIHWTPARKWSRAPLSPEEQERWKKVIATPPLPSS